MKHFTQLPKQDQQAITEIRERLHAAEFQRKPSVYLDLLECLQMEIAELVERTAMTMETE